VVYLGQSTGQKGVCIASPAWFKAKPVPDGMDTWKQERGSPRDSSRNWNRPERAYFLSKMEKIDFRKELKGLYAPSSKDFSVVDVPRMSFLMIDGEGNPNTAKSYSDAVEALYSVSYALKFASKKQLDKDHVVAPLEGLWSAADPSAFGRRAKDEWRWTMMIMQPAWITIEMVEQALAATKAKKNLPALPLLRFEEYDEGQAVQIGPKVAKAEISAKYHHVRRRDPTVSVAAYLIGTSHTD